MIGAVLKQSVHYLDQGWQGICQWSKASRCDCNMHTSPLSQLLPQEQMLDSGPNYKEPVMGVTWARVLGVFATAGRMLALWLHR